MNRKYDITFATHGHLDTMMMKNNTSLNFDLYESEPAMTPIDLLATAALTAWTLGFLWFITSAENNRIPNPPFYRPNKTETNTEEAEETFEEDSWNRVGIYSLEKPQTLSKAERQALTDVGGGKAVLLYEKVHPSGNKSWRYQIGDTWFYPRETAVRRRGLDMYGNHMADI